MISLEERLQKHIDVVRQLTAQIPQIESIAGKLLNALQAGGKIIWMGNGGSAADAQHLAAELVGRFTKERKGLASIALSANTATLTAIANDYGYENVFRRQIEALCQPNDIVIGLSTSGNSANVVNAMIAAGEVGAVRIGFTGQAESRLLAHVEECLRIPSHDTARTQEAHLLIGHLLCDWVEAAMVQTQASEEADYV